MGLEIIEQDRHYRHYRPHEKLPHEKLPREKHNECWENKQLHKQHKQHKQHKHEHKQHKHEHKHD